MSRITRSKSRTCRRGGSYPWLPFSHRLARSKPTLRRWLFGPQIKGLVLADSDEKNGPFGVAPPNGRLAFVGCMGFYRHAVFRLCH